MPCYKTGEREAMRGILSKSELGIQIQMMNDSYVRFQVFKNCPFDMNFQIDLNVKDIDKIIKGLKEEKGRLTVRGKG